MNAVRALAGLTAVAAVATGCGSSTPTIIAVPTLAVDLGTIDVGDGKTFHVSVPVDERTRRLLTTDARIQPHSDVVDLHSTGSGPGYIDMEVLTHRVANCAGFGTAASVMRDDREVLRLDLKAKVRRAFEIRPITEGSRYALRMAPGFPPPVATDFSDGVAVQIVPTGSETAELVVTRKRPPLVPGGMVRLMDRASRDSQTIELPMSSVPVSCGRLGELVDRNGEMIIRANSALTPDKPDVEVVLDPPGAYEIKRRGYVGGKLTLTLASLTRSPVDLRIGFRRKGRWVEVQSCQVD